jgi:type IV pilus assembly protein PilB
MGVPAFNVASSVSLIIAQRLARRLCKECKTPADDIPREVLLKEGFTDEMLATGHDHEGRGLRRLQGRLQGSGRHLRSRAHHAGNRRPDHAEGNSLEISRQARELGTQKIRGTCAPRRCCKCAAPGLVSLEEVNRVTID